MNLKLSCGKEKGNHRNLGRILRYRIPIQRTFGRENGGGVGLRFKKEGLKIRKALSTTKSKQRECSVKKGSCALHAPETLR